MTLLTDDASNFDYQIKGIAISYREGEGWFIPLGKDEDVKAFAAAFDPIFQDEKSLKIGHNLKGTMLALMKIGMAIKGTFFDTMIAHYLIEPEAAHDIHTISSQYLAYDLLPESHDDIRNRLCERADIALQLKGKLQQELEIRRATLLMRRY